MQSVSRAAWFIRRHWRLMSLLVLITFQIMAIAYGWVLLVIGGDILYITFHTAITTGYKVWQKLRAYLYNRWAMRTVRSPISQDLVKVFPSHSKTIKRYSRQNITFDAFKNKLEKNIPGFTEEVWGAAIRGVFGDNSPPVSIVVPIYDIVHGILEGQVRSIAAQTYPNLRFVYLVINDADDIATYQFLTNLVETQYNDSRIRFDVIVEGKPGKREAQYTGFQSCFADEAEIIGNMDGDGFAHEDAVAAHVLTFLADPRIGLTTGDVRVINWNQNFLTMQTGIRYHNAFWDERAGQSPEMICGSGPNLFIRSVVLHQIIDAWYTDEFLGVRSTYGDDRDLTLKAMEQGWKTVFVPDSISWTDCPTTLQDYRAQQKRWTKSGFKYNIKMYQSGLWDRLHLFVKFSVAYLMLYPFVVLFALAFVIGRAGIALGTSGVSTALDILAPYLVAVLIVGLVFQAMSGLFLMHDWRFLFAPLYFTLWFWVQLPLKFTAIFDLRNPAWGTRKRRFEIPPD